MATPLEGTAVALLLLMTQLSRNRGRRTFWTLLFLLCATVSMVGPTQAVSGAVSASVAVMETFRHLLDSGPVAQSAAAPAAGRAGWVDALLTPDFGEPFTPIPQPADVDDTALFSMAQAQGSANPAVSQDADTSPSSGAGGRAGSRRAARASAGLPLSGSGGLTGGALGIDSLGEGLALTEVAEPLSTTDLASSVTALSFAPDSLALGRGDDPGGDGSGSGSPVEPHGAAPWSFPTQSSEPGSAGLAPTVPGGGGGVPGSVVSQGASPPSVSDAVEPLITNTLADELGLPHLRTSDQDSLPVSSAAAGGGDAASSNDGFSLAQIPEPSALLLVSLGVAAVARRRQRQRT